MKYFFDTEFIEGFKKPIKWLPTIGKVNKPYHSIQLISIGIVCEDGRTYYAISNEYNYGDASDWVKENVIDPLYVYSIHGDARNHISNLGFHKRIGKPNSQIAKEILDFCLDGLDSSLYTELAIEVGLKQRSPAFYAYYADYDWVVFCSLFGTMMDLPKGFPMYCRDLKQEFDRVVMTKAISVADALEKGAYPIPKNQIGLQEIFKDLSKDYKNSSEYPKQTNEHNALDDAKWNFELYKFLKTL